MEGERKQINAKHISDNGNAVNDPSHSFSLIMCTCILLTLPNAFYLVKITA